MLSQLSDDGVSLVKNVPVDDEENVLKVKQHLYICDVFVCVKVLFKDGAYYCYCAYVLRIARYSGFLWVVHTNAGIFLRGLKLYGEGRT